MARRELSEIPDLILIAPRKFGDERGFFSEVYNHTRLAEQGFTRTFVQDNHAFTAAVGTVRGMHWQDPPHAQDKLVRVTRGAILDVALDLRVGSPTYGDYAAVTLSAENWLQLLVPAGFAHGYVTTEANTEVIYKVTALYAPDHDRGFFWADPDAAIEWGVSPDAATVSDKDAKAPPLAAVESPFRLEAG